MERPEIQLAQSVTRNFSIDVEYDYDEFGISRQSYVTIPGLDNSGTEGVNWSIGAMRLRGDLGLGTMGPHIVIGVRCANSFWDKIDGFEKMQLTVRNWPTDFDEAMDNEQAEREERWRGFRHTTIGYTAEELYADRLRDIHSHGIIFGLPPPSDSPQGFFENRLVLQLDITCKSIAPPPPPTPPIPLSIPAGYTDVHSSPIPTDVRFYFSSSSRILYANADSLSKASPYFKGMFDSGFTECVLHDGEEAQKKGEEKDSDDSDSDDDTAGSKQPDKFPASSNRTVEREEEREYDDSDDETDDFTSEQPDPLPVTLNRPFRRIKVDSKAYTTYRAVLCYMQTGVIAFAPLRSTFRNLPNSSSVDQRRAALLEFRVDTSHPLPASPKSIYRLANYLLLPELASLALANIKSQLTIENIAYEVFGDVAFKHEEVGAIMLEFASKNWKVVGKGRAMKEVKQLANEGKMPYFTEMSSQLLDKRLA